MSERINYNTKTQTGSYVSQKFNASDANSIKSVVNSHAEDLEDLLNRVILLEGGNPRLNRPSIATPTVISTTQINLSWSQPTNHNADTFDVYRGSTDVFANATKVSSNQAGLTYNSTGLTPNTTYYFWVVAKATGYDDSLPGSAVSAQTGTPLPIPAADTTPVNLGSGLTNSFSWTNNSLYPNVNQREKTLDGGTTVADLDVKPLVVGNVAKAPGQVGVRIKAAAGVNQASSWLFNTQAFIVDSGAGTVQDMPINNTSGDLVNTSNIWTKATGSTTSYDGGLKVPANTEVRITLRGLFTSKDNRVFFGIDDVQADPNNGWLLKLEVVIFQGENYVQGKQNNVDIGTAYKAETSNLEYVCLHRTALGAWTLETSANGTSWTVNSSFAFTGLDPAERFITYAFEGGGKARVPQLITY